MDKTLIIIRGVQGSGKSTLATFIRNGLSLTNTAPEHFEADMYFVDPVTGKYEWKGEDIGKAHRWCEYNVNKSMEEGKNVIVSNTFVKKKDYQVYLEMAQKHGYTVQEIICCGKFENKHGVPKEKVEEKRKAFEY